MSHWASKYRVIFKDRNGLTCIKHLGSFAHANETAIDMADIYRGVEVLVQERENLMWYRTVARHLIKPERPFTNEKQPGWMS